MTRDRLKVFDRYYMRQRGKQIPVAFVGFLADRRLGFRRLDNGEPVYRRNAGALSKHRDDCPFLIRPECGCGQELERMNP